MLRALVLIFPAFCWLFLKISWLKKSCPLPLTTTNYPEDCNESCVPAGKRFTLIVEHTRSFPRPGDSGLSVSAQHRSPQPSLRGLPQPVLPLAPRHGAHWSSCSAPGPCWYPGPGHPRPAPSAPNAASPRPGGPGGRAACASRTVPSCDSALKDCGEEEELGSPGPGPCCRGLPLSRFPQGKARG